MAIVDYLSRYLEIVVLQTVTSKDIISALQPIFAVHGLPVTIKTDNRSLKNASRSVALNTGLVLQFGHKPIVRLKGRIGLY